MFVAGASALLKKHCHCVCDCDVFNLELGYLNLFDIATEAESTEITPACYTALSATHNLVIFIRGRNGASTQENPIMGNTQIC